MTAPAWNKGFAALETCLKSDMISPCDQSDDTDDYRMNIDSPVFAPTPRSRTSSATSELGLSLSYDGKKTACGCCGQVQIGWYDRKIRRVRDKSCGDARICLDLEIRRVDCRSCGAVKQENLSFLADNLFYTKHFAYYVGRRCRSSAIKDVAKELRLDWSTVKALEMQYMRAQMRRHPPRKPAIIGIDEVSLRKGHVYRIVVSDLVRHRPLWLGGNDRSKDSMDTFFKELGS